MSRMKRTQRIIDIVKAIKNEDFRLPSIQRSFVWEEEKIYKLLDSLMNDYPIGSFLIWKPKKNLEIRTRKFIDNYNTGDRIISEEEPLDKVPYLVLDGQQRLQSLYLAFFGSYNGENLYFIINSDPEEEDIDIRYKFRFCNFKQVKNDEHWQKLSQIMKLRIEEIPEYVEENFSKDDPKIKRLISKNLSRFIRVFNMDENLLIQEVKEDLEYNDVLDVFVRVNSGGIVLSKSDLLFSTVVSRSPDMENNFIELIDDINMNGDYEFNIDFLIKCTFVLLNKRAKYDTNKLKDGEYINDLEKNFEKVRKACISTIEFLKTHAKILSKRFLKSDLALIPIIDFIYHQPHQQLPENQAINLRKYLYMSFFMRFYSYGPDGKIDVIHKIIAEQKPSTVFPVSQISDYIEQRTNNNFEISEKMLYDLDLVLNIVEGGIYEIPKKRGWSLEKDHIFPRSVLEGLGFSADLINSIGNFRYINKTRNIIKSNNMPSKNIEFYGSKDSDLFSLYLNSVENLTEETFRKFIEKRKEIILEKVKEFLGFC